MSVYQIDPMQDARWAEFVERHPKASVFQTVGWLEALHKTYAYSPIAFTTCDADSPLTNGIVFCQIRSWLTGDRIVSLPFSDHCEPLFDSAADLGLVLKDLQDDLPYRNWNYIEIRPANDSFPQLGHQTHFHASKRYCFHHLDLKPELNRLFRSLDADSAQRRIRRAERAGIVHECGRSAKLLKDFYGLLVLTRRRHRFPLQPYIWFQNLLDCMKDAIQIRVAYKAQDPIAAVLTLKFRTTVYYKYGCSNSSFKHLGGMPFLLWKTIEESKAAGAEGLDLGRSDNDNVGLISFKNHWAHVPTELVYWRFPAPATCLAKETLKLMNAKWIFARMPYRLLTMTGRLIYRHIG